MNFCFKTLLPVLFLLLLGCKEKKDPQPIVKNPPVDSLIYDPQPYNLSVPAYLGKLRIPADNPLTKEGVALGRMLFYEKKLSKDNSISCASCHKQELAFSDENKFSIGVGGVLGTRQSMSLMNLVYMDSLFFWDGRSSSLEHQVLFPIEHPLEMNQSVAEAIAKLQSTDIYPGKFYSAFGTTTITGELLFKAIAQFERTLVSYNSKFDKSLRGELNLTPSELRGRALFFTHPVPESGLRGGNCGDCHSGVLLTDKLFRNNGLDANFADLGRMIITGKSNDMGKFRVPSLRNIALTAPYMHDGRFNTLEEVMDHYNEHIHSSATLDPLIIEATNIKGGSTLGLTDQEKADIIAFMKTLTDSTIITNPEFSDPFKDK